MEAEIVNMIQGFGIRRLCGSAFILTLLLVSAISYVVHPLAEQVSLLNAKGIKYLKVKNDRENESIHVSIQSFFQDLPIQESETLLDVSGNFTKPKYHVENKEQCIKRLPQAIIVGIQKSGTSALLTFLSYHPQIAACLKPAETKYFSQYYRTKSMDWYRNLMPCSFSDQVTIEKSPPYFYRRVCAERIRKMNPDTKIIIIAKDPVERAISMYAMQKAHSVHNIKFEDLVTKNNRRDVSEKSKFITWSNYQKYMGAWLENFKLQQILVLDGHSLERSPAQELHKVENFLGIDRYFTADKFHFNATKGKYCISSTEDEVQCLNEKKGRPHPKIEEDVRRILRNYFRPLNEKFFTMINERLDWKYT